MIVAHSLLHILKYEEKARNDESKEILTKGKK